MLLITPFIFTVALASQMPFSVPNQSSKEFALVEGEHVFSPKDMLELPRPAGGLPNPTGDLALVGVSKHSFKDKETRKSIWLAGLALDPVVAPLEIPLAKGGDAFWLDSRTIAHVVPGEGEKGQEVYAISVKVEKTISVTATDDRVLIGTFPPGVEVSNFQYAHESNTLVFSTYVWPDHDISTVKLQDDEFEKRGNTAKVYDQTYPRHWDTWRGPKSSALFTTSLGKSEDGKWALGTVYTAPLKGTRHNTPVEPFGGTDDFALSSSHVLYTAKDPSVAEAWHTRQNVYIAPLDASSAPVELTTGDQGATHSPILSHSGSLAAWLELADDGNEADQANIVLYDLKTSARVIITKGWDRSPDSIVFSLDDKTIYLTAGDDAHVKIFSLPVPSVESWKDFKETMPKALTSEHAASALQPLPDGRLLFAQNSMTSPNELFVLAPHDGKITQITNFSHPFMRGIQLDKGESFKFEGAAGRTVQGWAVRPPGLKAGAAKSVPVLMLIHGGPQSAWADQWSTRWNPNVFAQQGYFVLAINPTGSTSFGQELTDAISEDWGGAPFEDLQKGWKYALDKYPEIDPNRAVAAGASWGGYAINWINGHPEYGFGFKALACHDGVFDTRYNGYSTDELFFFNHEFGGPPSAGKGAELSVKFNPSEFAKNWATPQLLIHGSKDYRLPETESLGAFNILQQKGIRSRLLVFPDENHWVLKPGNNLKWHYEVFRWFDEFVGGKE